MYEYKIVNVQPITGEQIHKLKLEEELNMLAKQGYRVVGVLPSPTSGHLGHVLLERQLPNGKPAEPITTLNTALHGQ